MMDVRKRVRLIGIDFGNPFGVDTFSGSSRYIWREFQRQGVLVDAFAPYPSSRVIAFYKLLAFRPSIQKWRATWRRSVPFRKYLTRRAGRIIRTKYSGQYNASLQIGAYYNLSDTVKGCRTLLADNNCAISQRTDVTFQSSRVVFEKQFEFEKAVYQSMERVFCFSAYLAKSMIEDFECDPDRVVVIGAGINTDESLIAKLDRTYASKTILFSGFNWSGKGGPVLLEAFTKIKRQVPDAKLIILGPRLDSTPDGVECYGPLSKDDPDQLATIAAAYQRASVFALPTLADAFPNVIREAMAAGLPCVASNIGAVPEMVEDGVTGYLVPTRNSEELANRLLELIENPDLARKMGLAGYERYQRQFTWERVCDKVTREIQRVIESQD